MSISHSDVLPCSTCNHKDRPNGLLPGPENDGCGFGTAAPQLPHSSWQMQLLPSPCASVRALLSEVFEMVMIVADLVLSATPERRTFAGARIHGRHLPRFSDAL